MPESQFLFDVKNYHFIGMFIERTLLGPYDVYCLIPRTDVPPPEPPKHNHLYSRPSFSSLEWGFRVVPASKNWHAKFPNISAFLFETTTKNLPPITHLYLDLEICKRHSYWSIQRYPEYLDKFQNLVDLWILRTPSHNSRAVSSIIVPDA